ncbi:hypothetical protein Q7P36_010230 [Cladosporium allicinum]
MPVLSSLLRPKLLALALWATALIIWLTLIGPPIPIPISFHKPEHHSSGALPNFHPTPISLKEHPIKTLVHQAQIGFADLLALQSQTLSAATSVYQHRYHKAPPPGFEAWYEFAVKYSSPVIDDFDIIDESLKPFWGLSGKEVRRRVGEVREKWFAIEHCESVNGNLTDGCDYLGEEVLGWLEVAGVWKRVPGVELLVNGLDEPRIMPGGAGGKVVGDGRIVWTDQSHSRVWDDVTTGCDFDHGTFGAPISTLNSKTQALTFASFDNNKPNPLDLCRHPEYSHMHGFWDSPMSLLTTPTPVPILSPAVLSTMGDIPFPAAAYTNEIYAYNQTEDVAWENKVAGLYWAGANTGSFQGVTDGDWKNHHRQRFVALVNGLGEGNKEHAYLARSLGRDGTAAWRVHKSSALDESLYSVHFTDVIQYADRTTNASIRAYFPIHAPEPRNSSFKYTLNFDIDGNGHSGRFYRLLNSRSLPLKQTVFREWHDERLKPWLHYVPVSLGMGELPEVVRYLCEEEEGRALAALMAEEGRRWSRRALRPVDQAVYLYRLMLELARLRDPGRKASSWWTSLKFRND